MLEGWRQSLLRLPSSKVAWEGITYSCEFQVRVSFWERGLVDVHRVLAGTEGIASERCLCGWVLFQGRTQLESQQISRELIRNQAITH